MASTCPRRTLPARAKARRTPGAATSRRAGRRVVASRSSARSSSIDAAIAPCFRRSRAGPSSRGAGLPSDATSAPVSAAAGAPIVSIQGLSKTYAGGYQALKRIDLDIRRGEIFALLGPNGAGKTTLISIVCGIVNPGEGRVLADGHDIVRDYRAARSAIGLVP